MIVNSRRVLGVLILVLSSGLGACSRTCDPSQEKDYCEDGIAHACFQGDGPDPDWHETTCVGSPAPQCVVASKAPGSPSGAFCIAGHADARCPPEPAQGGPTTFCAAGQISTCISGFVTQTESCTPGSPGCC